MNKKHKHCELIKAWADGAEIESWSSDDGWRLDFSPSWSSFIQYRIKPEPKPDNLTDLLQQKDLEIHRLRKTISFQQDVIASLEDSIKPEPKPDVVTYLICDVTGAWVEYGIHHMFPNHKGVIKVISDGQTGKPKSAEVLK